MNVRPFLWRAESRILKLQAGTMAIPAEAWPGGLEESH